MAEETSRTRSVRRITAPGDTGTYIDLKIIDDITFKEEKAPYQEWVLGFNNNPDDAARTVRVVEVGDAKLKVERIDSMDTTETTGRFQEAFWSFLNDQDPPVHLETHETTIYASDGKGNITDTGTWIKVQRIDKIEFSDTEDDVPGQEYVWNLDNPDKLDKDDDYKNLTKPVKTWDNTTINPPWRLDPFQTITDCSFGNYMLVLYGTNKIAYVPMASITSPAGKVTKKTLVNSSWSTPSWYADIYWKRCYRIKLCQVKISNTFNALSGLFKISSQGVVSLPSVTDETPVFNVNDTLLKSALSSTPWSDYHGTPVSPDDKEYVKPIINGANSSVWNDRGDKFTWSKNTGVVRDSIGDNLITYQNTGSSFVRSVKGSVASGITSNGGRFTDAWFDTYQSSFWQSINIPITNAQYTAATQVGVNGANSTGNYGPGESEANYATWSRGYVNGSATMNARVQVHEKAAGNLDKLIMGTCPTTISMSGVVGLDSSNHQQNITNYFGFNDTTDADSFGYFAYSLSFPPSLGVTSDKVYFYAAGAFNSPVTGGYIQTPYVRHEYPGNAWDELFFDPWLHASNGKHVIQGYDWTGGGKLWLDGVDYGEKLANAIGCHLDDIKAVVLDVKKSDIDKLK